MPKRKQPQYEYILKYQYQQRNGFWSGITRLEGDWMGLEIMQSQVKKIANSYPSHNLRISISNNGLYIDFKGQTTEKKWITLERKR
jgi:hypothetical protein